MAAEASPERRGKGNRSLLRLCCFAYEAPDSSHVDSKVAAKGRDTIQVVFEKTPNGPGTD